MSKVSRSVKKSPFRVLYPRKNLNNCKKSYRRSLRRANKLRLRGGKEDRVDRKQLLYRGGAFNQKFYFGDKKFGVLSEWNKDLDQTYCCYMVGVLVYSCNLRLNKKNNLKEIWRLQDKKRQQYKEELRK